MPTAENGHEWPLHKSIDLIARHSHVRRMNLRCRSATDGLEGLAVLWIILLITS